MENWGAIFTFEYALLLDPAISTQRDKQASSRIAAHEMAHQWFGDLVTMALVGRPVAQRRLRLLDGDAATAHLHPEWNTALAAVDGRDGRWRATRSPTTHPIVQHVATVEQANQAFDEITYQKGEAVIRMLEAYVGADAWPRRRAPLHARARLRQHAHRRPVARDRAAARQAA